MPRPARPKPSGAPKAGSLRGLVNGLVALAGEHSHLVASTLANYQGARPVPVSTEQPSLDVSLQIGGIPLHRFTVLHGPEGVGKTSLLLWLCGVFQRRGGLAVFVDAEHKLYLPWAGRMGVDADELLVVRPQTIEDGFSYIDQCLSQVYLDSATLKRWAEEGCASMTGIQRAEVPILICWDSLHAGVARRTLSGGYDGSGYAPESKAYPDCIRYLLPKLSLTPAALVASSQVRVNLDARPFQEKGRIGVGKGPGHYAAVIGELSSSRKKGRLDGRASQEVKVVWRKNQVGNPWHVGHVRIVDGEGLDRGYSLFHAAKATGLLTVKSSGTEIHLGDGEPVHFKSQAAFEEAARMHDEFYEAAKIAVMARTALASDVDAEGRAVCEGDEPAEARLAEEPNDGDARP